MQHPKKIAAFSIIGLTAGLLFSTVSFAKDFIMPSMVEIPAGTYIKSKAGNHPGEKSYTSVVVDGFQLSKYKVTVAEFKKFAEATGFTQQANCGDDMSALGLPPPGTGGTGHWTQHKQSHSDYQPVTCISWNDALAYVDWLSKESGIQFRIPTVQEWEYAAKANTTTRYYWGDDFDGTKACEYGNFADYSGESIQNREHGFSNIGWLNIHPCDDGESYISIVGLYRANPFGLFDMGGNSLEVLSTCFQDPKLPEVTGSQSVEECEYLAHRGGNWHGQAKIATKGYRLKRIIEKMSSDFSFRLATDHVGSINHSSITEFENSLAQAQQSRIESRPKLLATPTHVHALEESENSYQLRWKPVSDERVTGYDIYQSTLPSSHMLGYLYTRQYEKLMTVESTKSAVSLAVPKGGKSYKIVALGDNTSSLASKPVLVNMTKPVVDIPGKLTMDKLTSLDNGHVAYAPANDERPARHVLRKVEFKGVSVSVTGEFTINVTKAGWYQLNYKGSSASSGTFFTLWRQQKELAVVTYSADVDDSQSTRHKIYLPAGEHTINFDVSRLNEAFWMLEWITLTAMSNEKNNS